MASWCTPDFNDDIIEILPSKKSKLPPKHRSHSQSSDKLRLSARNVVPKASSTKTIVDHKRELWVNKYQPDKISQVAGNKAKIEELSKWLSLRCFSNSTSSKTQILLLSGPSGCGKTAAILSICREAKIQAQQWTNPHTEFTPSSEQRAENNVEYQSQISLFDNFMLKANKHRNLGIFDEELNSGGVILVEELPGTFNRQIGEWHRRLKFHQSRGKQLLIVVFNTSGQMNIRQLFPDSLQQELNIKHVEFNPVPKTDMKRILNHIISEEGLTGSIGSHELAQLCETCNGDIRYAVNSMQFKLFDGEDKHSRLSQTKRKTKVTSRRTSTSNYSKAGSRPSSRTANRPSSLTSARPASITMNEETDQHTGKDDQLLIFRGLGRVLYNKREETVCPEEPKLPTHLTHHSRKQLAFNPEQVFEQCKVSPDYYTLSLHQNLPAFLHHTTNLNRALDYLCLSDELTDRFTSNHVTDHCPISVSVASRGILHSNTSIKKPGWMPLKKPDWYSARRRVRDLEEELKWEHISPFYSYQSLVTDVIPALHRLRRRDKLTRLIPALGNAQFSRSVLRGEKLDEKDIISIDQLNLPESSVTTFKPPQTLPDGICADDEDEFIIEDTD